MKTFILLLILSYSSYIIAQDAPLKVNVTDFQGRPLIGEQILFEGETSKKVYKGISDKLGVFTISIPGGDTYMIKIKSVGEAKDYNSIAIPKLGPNQQYGEMALTVQIEQVKSFTLNNVHFDTGKSSLRNTSYKELNELVELMMLKPEMNIRIEGYTDNVGEQNANLILSQRRAETVKKYLISKGISAVRLTSKGFGPSKPVADNNSAQGRQKNRRTEVHVVN